MFQVFGKYYGFFRKWLWKDFLWWLIVGGMEVNVAVLKICVSYIFWVLMKYNGRLMDFNIFKVGKL